MTRTTTGRGAWRWLAALMLAFGMVGSMAATAQPARAEWSPPRTVYIPETGQTIDGYFLDVWRAWGVASLGYPVTPEVTENGRIVQYFQYARMEYWPEDPNGEVVKFGKIGEELRPLTIFRPGINGSKERVDQNREQLLKLRAWLPLDERSASRPNTEDWRYIPETGHSVQYGFKAFWEATGEAGYLGNPLTEEYILEGTTYQVFERGQLAWRAERGVWMVPVGEVLAQRYGLEMAPQWQGDIPTYSEDLFVPPPQKPQPPAGGPKVIEVILSTQYLIAWQGGVPVAETYVSTGRPGFDTPPGTYYVIYKLESEDMEGVLGGEYYNVPNVPWVMYFTSVGHAIHGAYWHNNFGAVMSHGCVNLPVAFAEWLYYWAEPGTPIVIRW